MRLEEHLDFDGVLAYLRGHEGLEQAVTVKLPADADDPAADEDLVLATTDLVATYGRVGRLDIRSDAVGVSSEVVATVRVGDDTEIRLARSALASAARLSMGPEVNALLVQLRGRVYLMLQDVLWDSGVRP